MQISMPGDCLTTIRAGACGYGDPLKPLDSVAEELGLQPEMSVTLYYEDPSEEFEVSAILKRSDNDIVKWVATPDWKTIRRIR